MQTNPTLKEKINNNVIVQRFKAETPPFWKKVQKIAGVIAGIATACASFPIMPETWRVIAGFIAAIAGVVVGGAQFTTTSPPAPSPKGEGDEGLTDESIKNNSK